MNGVFFLQAPSNVKDILKCNIALSVDWKIREKEPKRQTSAMGRSQNIKVHMLIECRNIHHTHIDGVLMNRPKESIIIGGFQ